MPNTPDPPGQATRDDTHLALLTLAYPAFTITRHHYHPRRPRWEIVRKNPQDPGLYAAITPDLDELSAVLAATITIKAGPSPHARPPQPEPPQ